MKKYMFVMLAMSSCFILNAQRRGNNTDTAWKKIYRASATKINDLVHTKLDVKFDYDKSYLYGKEWVTLKPHFYPTDSLSLDAKGMDIKEISIMKGVSKSPLKYTYDGMMLNIHLDRTYKEGEKYTVYIDYTSKPNEVKAQGSAAISDAKGLYFINPKGEDKTKPAQIWTQGETEANSVWFPTIDKPNQKTTEEIYMTVPAKYVTLSNGLLVSQKKNADGTRTDYWKMDLPHAPYLFFMGVGEYSIIKDHLKNGKEVAYYVEKEYATVARKIFGLTPAMIECFEKLTGVPFPWAKYDQIVGRDYVSGAMENTTATLHQESAYQNARQLVDGNRWEDVISHELFHQWFGDYVTTESWSNITLNESFADYGETLWLQCHYGNDYGDEHIEGNRRSYISGGQGNAQKDLVRFYYHDKEDVFDGVSYPKGGAILHMLRNYVSDDAFFKSLNKYLTDNKFKSAEAHNLRLAFEEVTGKDLNWFFNQWYFSNGHPKLNINYNYGNGTTQVIVEQKTDKTWKLPVAIDIYNGANKTRYQVWVQNKIDTFTFNTPTKPDLVNFDGDKTLLVDKTDNKTADNFIHQWKYAPLYMDRYEALNYFSKNKMKELAEGLNDKYRGLKEFTLDKLADNTSLVTGDVLTKVEKLANGGSDKKVTAAALDILVKMKDKKYVPLFVKMVNDSSYTVAGAAFEGLNDLDPDDAFKAAKGLASDAKGKLGQLITGVIMAKATEADFDFIYNQYKNAPLNEAKLQLSATFASYLAGLKDAAKIKKGVEAIMVFRNVIPEEYRGFTDPSFKQAFSKITAAKSDNKELVDYINGLIK